MAIADVVRSLLGRADPSSREQQDFLREAADMGAERTGRYRTAEDLYDGRLAPPLTTRQRQYLDRIAGWPVTENYMAPVVDKMASRLRLVAFRVEESPDAEAYLNGRFWTANNLDDLQTIVHSEVPKKGDGFLLGGFDNDRDVATVRWNRPEICKIVYDEETGDVVYVSKVWSTSRRSASNPTGMPINRLNVYFPDRIEKWFTASKNDDRAQWAQFYEAEGDAWPEDWTHNDEPLGVLGVHFRNKAGDRDYGRSELRPAVPFKHAIDKWILDQFDVMDEQGAKQRWASGVDDTRQLVVRRGHWVTSSRAEARFGAIEAEDPGPLGETIYETLQRMSVATATPFHDLIRGTPPTGEALKTAYMDHDAKCEAFTIRARSSWVTVAHNALRAADAFGSESPGYDPSWTITAEYAPVALRDDLTESQVAMADYELGASRATLLRRRGYDPDEEARARAKEDEAAMRRAREIAPPAPDGRVVNPDDA